MNNCFQWTGTPHWTGESEALVPIIVEPVVEVGFLNYWFILFQIRIPEMVFELKRGSMKEKWGLSIAFRFLSQSHRPYFVFFHREGPGGRVELGVSKVAMFSPAAKVIVKSLRKCTNFYVRLG